MLTLVIIHYNTPTLLHQCLTSIFSKPIQMSFQTIVVDNASSGTQVQDFHRDFSEVCFQFNQKNVGFAAACNQAIKSSAGRYILILNPDTLIDPDILTHLVRFMDAHPDVGVCGPGLLYPDGRRQLSCRKFPTLLALALRISRLDRLFLRPGRTYLMADWDHASVCEVDWVIGGCMFLRRKAVEVIGLLDDGFFMYYEDLDLCYRLKKAGWKTYYNPEVSVVHHHQRMSAGLLPNRLSFVHAKSLVRLVRKHRLPWC